MLHSVLLILGLGAAIYFAVSHYRAGRVSSSVATGKPVVAGTIFPLYDIARNVAGQEAVVRVIVPPGASPHLFEFSPRQLKDLQNVKVVFAIGHGLDDWAAQITNAVEDARVVVVDQGIGLRRFPNGATDPHYWLHLGNAATIADNIATALIGIDPGHAETYRENAKNYKEMLVATDRELKAELAAARGMPILTFHDGWFYFAEDFGMNIAGTFEPAAGEEPTPRYLAALYEKIEKDHIRIIFSEPQLSTGVLESFAKDNHVGIATLDPLGGVEGRSTYLELMKFNANSVRQALEVNYP